MSQKKVKKFFAAFGIAAVLFSVTLAVFIGISNANASALSKGKDTYIYNWKFSFSDNRKDLEENIDGWLQASIKNPVRKNVLSLKKNYIRLNTTLESNNTARTLELTTLNNPVRISVNGNIVADNGYEKEEFVLNRVITAEIPASGSQTEVDIYMSVPTSFYLRARLSETGSTMTDSSIFNQISYSAAISYIIIGILLICGIFIFSFKGKSLTTGMVLMSMLILSGCISFFSNLSLHYPGNLGSIFYRIFTILIVLGFIAILYFTTKSQGIKSRLTSILFYVIIAMGCGLAVIPAEYLKYLICLLIILVVGVFVMDIFNIYNLTQEEIDKSKFIFIFSSIYCLLCLLFDFMALVFVMGTPVVNLSPIAMAVFSYFFFLNLCISSIDKNIRKFERTKQIEIDSEWVKKTITLSSEIFHEHEAKTFFLKAVKAVRSLIMFDDNDDSKLVIRMAMVTDSGYEEIYTENTDGDCNYDNILRHANINNNGLMYSNHSVGMIFYNDGNPQCIMHIEGIKNALSINFENIINVVYSNINGVLKNIQLKMYMEETQKNVFVGLCEMVETRDHMTGDHLRVVSESVKVICEQFDIDEYTKDLVAAASMMHDLGKIATPDSIILKKGDLTPEETQIMRQHVVYGYNILSKNNSELMQIAATIAQQHHERYDGTGYIGLKGDDIDIFARIVSVADVFDALMSKRSYKDEWEFSDVDKYINEQSGKQFDPIIVEAYNRCKETLYKIKIKQ